MAMHSGAIRASKGPSLAEASAAVLMIHGRGDSAQGIISLAQSIAVPGVAYLAIEATGNTWYPYSFMSSINSNEPWLSSALEAVSKALEAMVEGGLPLERIVVLGFSQGACLASEFAARRGGHFGAVIALSGGIIGPDGTPRNYGTDLTGTRVFLGCSDVDPHIPVARVHETDQVLTRLGAQVDKRIYPGMAHTVSLDEMKAVTAILQDLSGQPGSR